MSNLANSKIADNIINENYTKLVTLARVVS